MKSILSNGLFVEILGRVKGLGLRHIVLLFCHFIKCSFGEARSTHCLNCGNFSSFPVKENFSPIVGPFDIRPAKFDSFG